MRSLTHTLRSLTCFGFFFVVLRKNCAPTDASVEHEGERARARGWAAAGCVRSARGERRRDREAEKSRCTGV